MKPENLELNIQQKIAYKKIIQLIMTSQNSEFNIHLKIA